MREVSPTEESFRSAVELSAGIVQKYHVERLNDPEGKHDECFYFVLDPKHDPLSRAALRSYADVADSAGYRALATELREWVASEERAQADRREGK